MMLSLRETPPPYFRDHSRESDLVNWWFQTGQHSAGLQTSDGQALIVVNAGQRNDGAGPDILNVVIILDDRFVNGAVEMHQRSSAWYRHGHANDPAYKHVILHVVTTDDGGPAIPTLIVPTSRTLPCYARRKLTLPELRLAAGIRFGIKRHKVERWGKIATAEWPVQTLGLMDVMSYGPGRRKIWHWISKQTGTGFPVADVIWRGSLRSRYPENYRQQVLKDLVDQIRTIRIPELDLDNWRAWEKECLKAVQTGSIHGTQIREWLVNWLVPYQAKTVDAGLAVWSEIPVARHYGFERKIGIYTGWRRVKTSLEQQGFIQWWRQGCKPQRCQMCPLVQDVIGN